MNTLVIGDMHCKQEAILPAVTRFADKHDVARMVFLGDYTDEWDTTAEDVLDALAFQAEWAKDQRDQSRDIIFLIGNHDFEYMLKEGCSGTHLEAIDEIKEALDKMSFSSAACINGYLLTHAGLTQEWREEYMPGCENAEELASRINELYLSSDYYDWRKLAACGPSRGGYEIPSPLWADVFDLKRDASKGIKQIVGHTPVSTCAKIKGIDEEVWTCDTFSITSEGIPIGDGSVLLLSDDSPRRVRLK